MTQGRGDQCRELWGKRGVGRGRMGCASASCMRGRVPSRGRRGWWHVGVAVASPRKERGLRGLPTDRGKSTPYHITGGIRHMHAVAAGRDLEVGGAAEGPVRPRPAAAMQRRSP